MTTIPIRQLQVLDNRHAPGIIALIFGASKMRFCSQLLLPNAFFTLAHFSVTFYILCPPPRIKKAYTRTYFLLFIVFLYANALTNW